MGSLLWLLVFAMFKTLTRQLAFLFRVVTTYLFSDRLLMTRGVTVSDFLVQDSANVKSSSFWETEKVSVYTLPQANIPTNRE